MSTISGTQDLAAAQAYVARLHYDQRSLNHVFSWFWAGAQTPVACVMQDKIRADIAHPLVQAKIRHSLRQGRDGEIFYLLAHVLPGMDIAALGLQELLHGLLQKESFHPIDLCALRLLLRHNPADAQAQQWLRFKQQRLQLRQAMLEEMQAIAANPSP